MSKKRNHSESVEEKSGDDITSEPPAKKMKLNNENAPKQAQKQKPAKPYQCGAAGYQIGRFTSLNTARLEFKALFGMNRLTVAWSDVTTSQIRDAYHGSYGLFEGFGGFGGFGFNDMFSGISRAAELMNNMTTQRVEINIDNIDSIQITNGGDVIKLIIITNYPPIFTKQMSSRSGKGNKFKKSDDPTNGNALKYKKHIIYLSKKPTLNNIVSVENKLKNGSAKLAKLFDEKAYEKYQDVASHDMYNQNVIDDAMKQSESKEVGKKKKVKRKKRKKKEVVVEDENVNTSNNKKKSTKRKKRKRRVSDESDEEWLP